jgi:hypothetical protein
MINYKEKKKYNSFIIKLYDFKEVNLILLTLSVELIYHYFNQFNDKTTFL